jgi:hypothetical protein
MDRNDGAAGPYRPGDRIGGRQGQRETACEPCGLNFQAHFLNVLVLLHCVKILSPG